MSTVGDVQTATPPRTPIQELPLTVIKRQPTWQVVNFRELWRYRELLFFLSWRDITVRYKQTVFGIAWAMLQPVATMAAFALFLGKAPGVVEGLDYPYSLFVFAGLLPWMFFGGGISSAGQSVVLNQNLVTKVYFPRVIIPLSALGVGLLDFFIGLGMLLLLMVWYGIRPTWNFLLVFPLLSLLIMAALGVGTLLAALTVAYRDFRFIVPFMVQVWMFATPTIYMQADKVVGDTARWLLPLNPAYGLIVNFRQAVLGRSPDYYSLAVSAVVSMALLVIGCLYFHRAEKNFADII